MLAGILSNIERSDLIMILRSVAYGLYQTPPLSEDEKQFLQQIIHLFNIDDYSQENIYTVDMRYELDFNMIVQDMFYASSKALLFMLRVTSQVIPNSSLDDFTKKKVVPHLPFSKQIQKDIIKYADDYINQASKIYNFIWNIERAGIFRKTSNYDIDHYQKLFFIDNDKLNQISSIEKEAFFIILIYLMLDDGKIDDVECDILSKLSFLLGVKESIVENYESCAELNLSIIDTIKAGWLNRLIVFSFLFSREGNIEKYDYGRIKKLLYMLKIPEKDFDCLLSDVELFRNTYINIVNSIQSSEISGPADETNAEYAKAGLSLLGAAVSLIPGISTTVKVVQTVNQISTITGQVTDKRSSGIMDFGLTDIKKDTQNDILVICIDGFLSELADGQFQDWKKSLDELELNAWVKGFKWPSSSLSTLLKSGGAAWYEAVSNTAKAGARLANDIEVIYGFRSDIKIALMGHSLGSRVIFNCLTSLNMKGLQIYEAYFFGGAVNRTDKAQWLAALNAVEREAYNFYSANDDILKRLYQGTMMGDSPAGLGMVECHKTKEFNPATLTNIDTTDIIGGHTEYKDKLNKLFQLEKHDYGILMP